MLLLMMFVATTPVAGAERGSDDSSVQRVVQSFVRAADQRDAATLESLLAPSFRVVFAVGDGAPSTLSRSEFLGLLAAGKLGGKERSVAIVTTRQRGPFAFVQVRLEHASARFEGELTLAREGGTWRLVHDTTVMTPK